MQRMLHHLACVREEKKSILWSFASNFMYFWWVFLLGFLSLLWFLFNPSARSRSGASKARIAVMGGKLSQESRSSLPRLSSGNHYVIEDDQQYRQQSPLPPPPAASSSYSQAPSGYSHAPPPRSSGKRLSRKYSLITDQFTNVEQVCVSATYLVAFALICVVPWCLSCDRGLT